MKIVNFVVGCLLLFSMGTAAETKVTKTEAFPITKDGMVQVLEDHGYSRGWLAPAMRLSKISVSRLRHLPVGTKVNVLASWKNQEPPTSVALESNKIIATDHRRYHLVDRITVLERNLTEENKRVVETQKENTALVKTLAGVEADRSSFQEQAELRKKTVNVLLVLVGLLLLTLFVSLLRRKPSSSRRSHDSEPNLDVLGKPDPQQVEFQGERFVFTPGRNPVEISNGVWGWEFVCPCCGNQRIRMTNIMYHLSKGCPARPARADMAS